MRFPVLTTSTLAQLDELRPQSRFDQRRFRMNVIVKTERLGFVENGWVGHKLKLGDRPRLNVAILDPRCVMTTLVQDGLPQARCGAWRAEPILYGGDRVGPTAPCRSPGALRSSSG